MSFDDFKKPNRFVGMHAHDGYSTYDGLGYPADHLDFVLENGMDAFPSPTTATATHFPSSGSTVRNYASKDTRSAPSQVVSSTLFHALRNGKRSIRLIAIESRRNVMPVSRKPYLRSTSTRMPRKTRLKAVTLLRMRRIARHTIRMLWIGSAAITWSSQHAT